MNFFFKKKEIVIDCFTDSKSTYDFFPINYSSKYLPTWWEQLPKEYVEDGEFWKTSTLKRCRGFLDFYKYSFSIPLWSDLQIRVDSINEKTYDYQFADRTCTAISHSIKQRGNWLRHTHAHLKLNTPWLIKCKHDVKFSWMPDSYNLPLGNNIDILPGVIDFKYQHSVNINLMVKFPEYESESKLIKAGTPMVVLVPHSEYRIKIKKHLVSSLEFHSITTVPTFTNFYNFKKKNDNRR